MSNESTMWRSAASLTQRMGTLFARPVRALLAALLAVFDLTPFVFLLPVPESDSWIIAGLGAICVAAGYCAWFAFKATTRTQLIVLPFLAVVAVLNVSTQIAMTHLPATLLDRVSTDYIASLFGLDGEFAYDAAIYELWCELWLCLALVVCAIGWAIRKLMRAKS